MAKNNSLVPMRELEKISGFSRATINYYIREGLLPAPRKSAKNMAYYDDEFIKRLKIIRQMKTYHFSLKQIKHSLSSIRCGLDSDMRTRFQEILDNSIPDDVDRHPVTMDTIRDATGLTEELLQQLVELKIVYLVNAGEQRYDGSAIVIGKMIRKQLDLGISTDTILSVAKKLVELSALELRSFSREVRRPLHDAGVSFQQQAESFKDFLESANAFASFLHLHLLRMPLEKMNIIDTILDDSE